MHVILSKHIMEKVLYMAVAHSQATGPYSLHLLSTLFPLISLQKTETFSIIHLFHIYIDWPLQGESNVSLKQYSEQ